MADILTDAQLEELEAKERKSGFVSDEEMASMEGDVDQYARQTDSLLRSAGKSGLEAIGQVGSAIDRFTGAPIRAAVGAAQKGQPVASAFGNQFLREASTAPSGKEIAAGFGLSEEDVPTPLIANPFTLERYKASPAGIVGGLGEAALDPLTYLPGGLAKRGIQKGAGVVEKLAPKAGKAFSNFAEERAIKAATGENIGAIKKLAKVKGKSASDAGKALGNLRSAGRELLTPDPNFDKKPAIGWLTNAPELGMTAADRKRFYGGQIGEVGPVVDELSPGAITPEMLAQDVEAFSKEIPRAGKGAPVRKRVGEEANTLRQYGLAEEELGPAPPLTFKGAQELKGQYPFEPQSPDLLISDKDASNRLNRIVGQRMDQAVEGAKAKASPEQLAKLQGYDPAKKKYGVYKDVADAGAEQGLRTLSRRVASPSSTFLGAQAGSAVAQVKDDLAKGGLWGAGVGLVNQQLLERGSAFASRSADAISRKLMAAPKAMQKWGPRMQRAAQAGNAAVLAAHHQLMNNDPEYRALMLEPPMAEEGH